jgi:hypothetical protein
MKLPKPPRPLDALFPVLALILLWPALSRYERPVQDRDFGSLGGGSADFASYYLGSLALVRGFDPYLNGRPEFRDPWQREISIDGVAVGQYYLPGHYLAFAPLAWMYGDRWEQASSAYFKLHAALLVLLAWLVSVGARGGSPLGPNARGGEVWRRFAVTMILLGLHVGVRLGLERGQSDALQAVLLWGGVLAAARGHIAGAAFLFVAGASFKGYGLILLVGLGLSRIGRRDFGAFLAGGLAAGLPILGLTWPFLSTSLRVVLHQSEDFSFHWMNHSFKHVGWAIAPGFADPIRYLLSLVALVAALLWWNRDRWARQADPQQSTTPLVMAATLSIAAMLGYSGTSAPYNLVLVLPGLVWLGARLAAEPGPLSPTLEGLFSVSFLLIALDRTPFRQFAPAAYGLVLLVVWSLFSVRGRDRPVPVD